MLQIENKGPPPRRARSSHGGLLVSICSTIGTIEWGFRPDFVVPVEKPRLKALPNRDSRTVFY
jgi:hypothetical protein